MSNIEVFTRKQAAAILGVSPKTIWYYQKKGWLEIAFRIGNRPRYTLEAIENVVKERTNGR